MMGELIYGSWRFCEFCEEETLAETNHCEQCWQEFGTA